MCFLLVGIARADCTFLRTCVNSGRLSLFGTDIVAAVVKFKWDTYGLRLHVRELLWYSLLVGLFTLDVYATAKMDVHSSGGAWWWPSLSPWYYAVSAFVKVCVCGTGVGG